MYFVIIVVGVIALTLLSSSAASSSSSPSSSSPSAVGAASSCANTLIAGIWFRAIRTSSGSTRRKRRFSGALNAASTSSSPASIPSSTWRRCEADSRSCGGTNGRKRKTPTAGSKTFLPTRMQRRKRRHGVWRERKSETRAMVGAEVIFPTSRSRRRGRVPGFTLASPPICRRPSIHRLSWTGGA